MTPACTCARSARPGSSGSSASGLLVLGTLATLALHVLPHSFERPLAVPTGVALIGLGISLWRDQRKTAAITADGLAPARVEPAAVR